MKGKLLDILCCPTCFGELNCTVDVQDGDQIEEGKLNCLNCQADYPIKKGIPRFVKSDNYASSFGLQWNLFKSEQIDDQNGSKISEDRFYAVTEWEKDWLKGKLILDAGCGAGRFLDVVSKDGAEVVGVDLSNAVDASKVNMAGRKNVHLVQASIYELPFRPETFDGCYCIGVVQHTPEPPRTLRCLAEMIKVGGKIGLFIYERRRWWTTLFPKYLLRPLTTRMKQENLLRAIKISMPIMFPLTEVAFRIPYLNRVFKFLIPISNYVDSDWAKDLNARERYQWAIMDTFDMFAPAYDQPQVIEEVKPVLTEAGITDLRRTNGIGLCLTGNKAAYSTEPQNTSP
jgi:2-polyprenyl-3-methyl-5-hydroxy-6-metoxy-1,4-benzoquinol methylase